MQHTAAPVTWRRSTACLNGACVEVAESPDTFFVRDSKTVGGPILAFNRADWAAFIREITGGRTQRR